jgi:predicted nucleic acid-binding protein
MGVPIQPVTVPIALRAGQIDGQSQAKGVRIPLSHLLIGASALELGYGVGTANVRHYQLVPGLNVTQPLNGATRNATAYLGGNSSA